MFTGVKFYRHEIRFGRIFLLATRVELTTFNNLNPGGFNNMWQVISSEPVLNTFYAMLS